MIRRTRNVSRTCTRRLRGTSSSANRGVPPPNDPPAPVSNPFVWGKKINDAIPGFQSRSNSSRSVPGVASNLHFPYPTNIWWKNLLVSGYMLDIKPYIARVYSSGYGLCFPNSRSSSASGVAEGYIKNFTVECAETIQGNTLIYYDEVTLKHEFYVDGTHYMIAPVVRGTVMFTMKYTGLTPKFWTDNAILSVNGQSVPGSHTGTKFKVVLNNGQTWIIYASSSITLTSTTINLTANAVFTGTIQAVLLKSAGDEDTLDSHALNYPEDCTISHEVSGDTDTETWTFTKTGSGNFLWHELMIHRQTLVSPTETTLKYKRLWMDDDCVALSVGTTLTFQQTLPTIRETYQRFDADKVAAIQTAFASDKSFDPGISNDPYFGGKALAKLAELGFLSAHPDINDPIARTAIVARLKTSVVAWLDNLNTNKMSYDITWGGVSTQNGLGNSGADFGSGIYNDHHFHWGYHVRAAALLAKYDSNFLAVYKDKVNSIVRDYMNPDKADAKFTRFRNFDAYHSHMWADGLTNFNDVHNQESTSESVNGLYAAALWGMIIGDENIQQHARILLGKEIMATNLYWHHKTADTELESVYEGNKITGIAWETKMDFATWFGANAEYIYGIQMIPYTPIIELIQPSDWVTELWPVILSKVFNRSFPVGATTLAGGTGYSGSNGGGVAGGITYTIANNVSVSGGHGTGLKLNMNINSANGSIWQLFVVYGQEGSGYQDGDIVTLVNGSGGLSAGGSGAQILLQVDANGAWKGLLIGAHSVIDKETAWTEMNALSSWDDGTTKTNMLAYVASRGNSY